MMPELLLCRIHAEKVCDTTLDDETYSKHNRVL